MNETNVTLQAQQLTKVYHRGAMEVHALRGVDLDFYQGELVVLLGLSDSVAPNRPGEVVL